MARPTEYNPEYCQRVIELGRAGKSVTQMASALDVHKDTVYEWAKKHEEFSDALSRARQESQTWWEDQGQMGLTADRFQPSLWAKQVSCRFPDDYRDKQDLNVGGQNGTNPVETKVTVEFIRANP